MHYIVFILLPIPWNYTFKLYLIFPKYITLFKNYPTIGAVGFLQIFMIIFHKYIFMHKLVSVLRKDFMIDFHKQVLSQC